MPELLKYSLYGANSKFIDQNFTGLLIINAHEARRIQSIKGKLEVAHDLLLQVENLIDQNLAPALVMLILHEIWVWLGNILNALCLLQLLPIHHLGQ